MQQCTPGKYCATIGLSLPTGDCDAGYYCPLQSSSSQQVNCPIGHYCPTGSDLPEVCRNGTYGPVVRLQSADQCTPCDGGYYCNGTALTAYSGVCDAGYYCPPGQTVPNPYDYLCTPGHYCPQNSTTPTRCSSGYYQNVYGQDTCKPCPEGKTCYLLYSLY